MLVVFIGVIAIGAMESVGVGVVSMFEDAEVEVSMGGTGDDPTDVFPNLPPPCVTPGLC